MSSSDLLVRDAMSTGPTSLYNLFNHCLSLVGYLCIVWGMGITRYASTLVDKYYFSSYGMWCGGVGIIALSLCIV